MTAVKITIFSFSCDQPGCREVVEIMPDLPYLSYAARQLREREGWATGQGRYFCPAHKRSLRSAGLPGHDPWSLLSRFILRGGGLVAVDTRVQVHVVPPVGCRTALRRTPSAAKPALAATRQDAGFATECTSSMRWKPISPNAQRDSAASDREAIPEPRAARAVQ
jgi:hypothetical protein